MKWMIGLDLRPRSHGAVHFARWLASASGGREEIHAAVHVLDEDHLRAALKYHHLDEVTAAARAGARETLAREAPELAVGTIEVVQSRTPHEGLAEQVAALGADALVVGRIARRAESRIVRLGGVARRLLRRLPCPVVVVPPDLETAGLGPGPIVALTSLGDDAVEACRFAARLAERLGRPLVVAHVVSYVELPFLTGTAVADAARDAAKAGVGALTSWIATNGLGPAEPVILQGEILDRADVLAAERGAPLLVVGAARHAGLERLTAPSIGRELAATASVPVAVVPPRG
jgi:nucleotide-binding universal stress UspA family protein